jgi:hypothetical protein
LDEHLEQVQFAGHQEAAELDDQLHSWGDQAAAELDDQLHSWGDQAADRPVDQVQQHQARHPRRAGAAYLNVACRVVVPRDEVLRELRHGQVRAERFGWKRPNLMVPTVLREQQVLREQVQQQQESQQQGPQQLERQAPEQPELRRRVPVLQRLEQAQHLL